MTMTRTITVSTGVFAAIWANRKDGEETEDAILGRLLDCGDRARVNGAGSNGDGGVYDSRNEVHFPEGFEVFRNYKRKEYKAIAHSGVWVREDTGERYPTLNQLNESIVSGNENVWNGNWKYRTPEGSYRSIDTLRG
jgi:hypothetical protein